ncbi:MULTISPECIES: DUF1214 domain-containing protein [Ramlibacter]|nr:MULTISPECIES: DUF1214 domain-containing protein [Ramlibacter]MBA2963792.1 DUF1254 domain-containing protein [Ramlibacter sp. CGMCC 1.13660]
MPSDKAISDAYLYLLGRLLVLRQQRLDVEEGFRWNQLVHRKPGGVVWPNPNLDVAYSEAWVVIAANDPLRVTVPEIRGRYYTVQFLNGWGETVANINERVFPDHPHGEFAVCLKGSSPSLPAGVQRVEVPVTAMRVLLRVQLGADWAGAESLQHQFEFRSAGLAVPPVVPPTPMFELRALPGVEAFDSALAALDSEADINPGMEQLQAGTRALALAVRDPAQRQRVDAAVRTRAMDDLHKAMAVLGHGEVRNHWVLPSTSGVYGDDWLVRTLINYGGIWANTPQEVVYYKGMVDNEGQPLNGDHAYRMTFTRDQRPENFATFFWSVIAVDAVERRVLPNPLKRYLLNPESGVASGPDGSLTLTFGDQPPAGEPPSNWLPTPKGTPYSLTFRFYRARGAVADRCYFPPPLLRA